MRSRIQTAAVRSGRVLQAGEHLVHGYLAEDAHAFGERVAVIGDDAAGGQQGGRAARFWFSGK